ncbi:LOW QUALITY PROTEIN: olfactory receptor 6V1-like [Cebus imitator]|uniref:LOW QUALITY PROTEIN: olfactory receptor 6V1-like n=1 Tax=Cebus imitator TaxID=2715852 RepID=UPI00189729EA|nr:LOW QUALITY PROTEIN: olfactory receptor 6V1-like [Cebus imitator]
MAMDKQRRTRYFQVPAQMTGELGVMIMVFAGGEDYVCIFRRVECVVVVNLVVRDVGCCHIEWASSTVGNYSIVREFELLGFSHLHEFQVLFAVILLIYLLTLLGNLAIISLTFLDFRLHSPMYFFLCNFSLMEMLATSTVVPRMLADLLFTHRTMSLAEYLTQSFFYFSLGSTNFLILTFKTFDCYVAICRPLHYPTIMNGPVYVKLVVACWMFRFLSIVSPTLQKTRLWFCGPNVIDHYFCDSAPLLKLACSDTRHIECMDLFLSLIFVMITMLLIILSYILIVAAVLHIPSFSGRQKAFSTCASHLTVVVLGYGSAIFIYVRPGKGHSTHLNKVMALVTALVTPFLNPFIFTFQNEKVKEVMEDVTKRIFLRDPAAWR